MTMAGKMNATARLPPPHYDELERMVKEGRFRTMSEALTETSALGLRTERLMAESKDPARAKQMAEDLRLAIRKEGIAEWVSAQAESVDQVKALAEWMVHEAEGIIPRRP